MILCTKYYNDYMINFSNSHSDLINKDDKFISGIKKITLEKIDMQFTPEITDSVNNFYIYQNEDIDIDLEPGDYSLNDIIVSNYFIYR